MAAEYFELAIKTFGEHSGPPNKPKNAWLPITQWLTDLATRWGFLPPKAHHRSPFLARVGRRSSPDHGDPSYAECGARYNGGWERCENLKSLSSNIERF